MLLTGHRFLFDGVSRVGKGLYSIGTDRSTEIGAVDVLSVVGMEDGNSLESVDESCVRSVAQQA